MKKPLTETELDELQTWLEEKMREDIEVMSETNGKARKRLMFERDHSPRFCIIDSAGWVGFCYYEDLTEAVRAFESHVARPQPTVKL